MTLTLKQMDALCEAAEHADDKTMFNVRAVVNAILPLYRAMVIEECAIKWRQIFFSELPPASTPSPHRRQSYD